MSDMSYPTKENSQFMNVQGGEKKVMKKILSVALSTAMAFSMFASVAFGETAKASPEEAFNALAAKGILNGYPDGQAHLEKDLTRAEFAKIITKLFGLQEVTGQLTYKDKGYTATNWAVPYIEAVTKAGYMQGQDTVKGIFNYNGKVTVEEVAAVLARALKLESPTAIDNSASVWAKGYAQAVINAGFMAQNVDFKANATRSQVVAAAYLVDLAQTKVAVKSAVAQSPTSVLVTFADNTTTTVTLTTALVEGVETTIPTFTYKGFEYAGVKVTLEAPKVISAAFPNAKQLVVKFNRAIDSSTVISSTDNTLVDGVIVVSGLASAEAVTLNSAKAVLSGDKTELTLTLPGSLAGEKLEFFKGQYTVTVTNSVKTDAGSSLAAYTTLLTAADTTAPTIVSATAAARTSINKVTVKVSEPVILGRIIATVDGASAEVAYGSDLSELILTTSKNLESGKQYNLSLLNLIDYAQNTATPNPATTTVTVSSDVVAPAISSVTVVGERQVEVTFSKGIDKNSLNGAVRVLNGNGEFQANMNVEPTSENAPTKLTLTLPASVVIPSSGTLNATLVFPNTIKDILGNTMAAAATHSVSFVKDTVAPTVTSVTYTSTGIAIKFSEKVQFVGGAGSATLINESTGKSEAVSTEVLNNRKVSSDDTTITLPVTGLSGSYTLRLNTGFVKDKAGAPNNSAAAVVSFTATATTSTDSTKPQISNLRKGAAAVGASDQFVQYDVIDAGGLNIASVRDINNYTLDGKALPTGSFVTTNATSNAPTSTVTVSVYIPSSAIGSSATQRFVVNGIKDVAGNTADAAYESYSFPDSVKPTLVSGAISSDASTRAILTFSEDVLEGTVQPADFIVKVNGVEANNFTVTKFTNSKYYLTVNALSGTYNGYKVLFFDKNGNNAADEGEVVAYTTDSAGAINFSSSAITTVTVEVKDTADIADTATPVANKIVTGTVITVK
ncbi:S-layer homology domain-containing protein [Paenibacillus tengchongensis]|uniref:S-layer homology domain-containing protein n=1 Tax=Paenibacillus tengchongensis TaxID=2608684 RepID=UPI00124C6C92|nr:S-layer homology domain-containing protein [Paenibacillus tengchongensis]